MTGENNLGLKINCIIQLTAPDITGVFQVELDRETVNNSEKMAEIAQRRKMRLVLLNK